MIAALPVEVIRAIRLTLVFALVTGLAYSLAFTGIGQVFFPSQANGSLITRNGQVIGSSLIGIFAVIGFTWLIVYGLLVTRIREIITTPRVRQWMERVTGVILLGFGARLAVDRL